MDDAFSFRTSVPLRREYDPVTVKAAVFGALVVLGVGLFSNWVIRSERESFSRAGGHVMPFHVRPGQVEGPNVSAANDAGAQAEEVVAAALAVATTVFDENRSFLEAGPAQLSARQRGYTFVDGPSTAPTIVSVASTAETWAAAVQGPSGICYWIRTTSAGAVSHGIGLECTGAEALDPSSPTSPR